MGRANVTILKTNKLNSDGNPVWHLLVADAPHLEEKESEESSGEKLSEIEF